MTTKCSMEAVHIQTSTASQMEHQTLPKIHKLWKETCEVMRYLRKYKTYLKTSYMAENGSTMMPNMRSAQASETMKRLVAPRSLWVMRTAAKIRGNEEMRKPFKIEGG